MPESHIKIQAKEAKSLMMEVCATYMSMTDEHKKIKELSSHEDFAIWKIKNAVDCFGKGIIDIQSFLFTCKLYGLFLKNFVMGTPEERMRLNLEQIEDYQMEKCIVCLSRIDEDWDSVNAEL